MLPTDGKPALFCVLHVKMLPSLKNYLNIYASILNSSHWVKLVASSLTVLRIGFFLFLEHFVNVNAKPSTSFPFTVKRSWLVQFESDWEPWREVRRMSDISKLLFNINKWWVRFEEQVFDWLDLRIGSGSFLITLVPPDNKKKQSFPFFLELKWWSCTEPVLLKGQGRNRTITVLIHSQF